MIPRVIYGSTIGLSSAHTSVEGSCCPICLSEHWAGQKGFWETLLFTINLYPSALIWLVLLAPFAFVFLIVLLLFLMVLPVAVFGLVFGSATLDSVISSPLTTLFAAVLLPGFAAMAGIAQFLPYLIPRFGRSKK